MSKRKKTKTEFRIQRSDEYHSGQWIGPEVVKMDIIWKEGKFGPDVIATLNTHHDEMSMSGFRNYTFEQFQAIYRIWRKRRRQIKHMKG